MKWDPREWFSNKQSGMTDGQAEDFYGGGGYSTWDSDSDETVLYPNESSMDAFIQSEGSPWFTGNNNQVGSPSFVSQFGKMNPKDFLSSYSKDKEPKVTGPGVIGKFGGPSVIPFGTNRRTGLLTVPHPQGTFIPAAPNQRSGSGIGGTVGSLIGWGIGNTIAPGIGGKIGGTLGGSIGSSFG